MFQLAAISEIIECVNMTNAILWGAHFVYMCITFQCVILVVVNYAHSSCGFYGDLLRNWVPCERHSRKKRHFTQTIHSWRRGNDHLNLSKSSCIKAFEWFYWVLSIKFHMLSFDCCCVQPNGKTECDNRCWSVFLVRHKRRPLTTGI